MTAATQPHTITCLLAALKEAQDTVRSYDTKAQIVGVGFIFSINIIAQFGEKMGPAEHYGTIALILSWLLAIGPIVLFGFVLYPSRRMMEGLGDEAADVRHTFYLIGRKSRGFESYLADVEACDWPREIAAEIVKVTQLRDIKRHRFVRALSAAGISYVIIVLFQLGRSQDVLKFLFGTN